MIDAAMMYQVIYTVYQKCRIKSFPIDCFQILDNYEIAYKTYSSLNNLRECYSVSNDAFTARNTIFYNDTMPKGRIAFSLMHEFAHLIMDIPDGSKESEDDADCFASNILAPRVMIHYLLDKKDAEQIHDTFGLSYSASNHAVGDYKKWAAKTDFHKQRKLSAAEQNIYDIFLRPKPVSVTDKAHIPPEKFEPSVRSNVSEYSQKYVKRIRQERKNLAKQRKEYEKRRRFLLKYVFDYNDFRMAESMRSFYDETF